MMKYKETENYKMCKSKDYNFVFNKTNGKFLRFGKSFEDIDDPIMAPNPEILDIEISTICHQNCPCCYKSNTSVGKNMTLEEFKEIFGKFDTRQLGQIAIGLGDVRNPKGELVNPDLYNIMEYTRNTGVISNLTINSFRMTDYDYEMLAKLAGAVAVSHYSDDSCFNCVQKLTEAGLKQVNIHQLLCEETFEDCKKLVHSVKEDSRLTNLGSIVFLLLKQKGTRNTLTPIKSIEKYKELLDLLFQKEVSFGMDSCSCNNFLKALKLYYPEKYDKLYPVCEPCESSLFSFYINASGIAFPCSFCEGMMPGFNMKDAESFTDIWSGPITHAFREKLISTERSCFMYDLEMK